MTKDQFLHHWRHEMAGIILDATKVRGGAEQALFLRSVFAKIDKHLGSMFDQLSPAPVPVKPAEKNNAGPAPR